MILYYIKVVNLKVVDNIKKTYNKFIWIQYLENRRSYKFFFFQKPYIFFLHLLNPFKTLSKICHAYAFSPFFKNNINFKLILHLF